MRKSFVFSPKMNSIQFKVLFRRYMKQICTNVWTIVPLILEAPFLLIITSFVYEDGAFVEPARHFTASTTTLFLLALSSALMGLLNSYREICKEREVLSREVFGGLDVTAYVYSKVTVLAIVGFVQTLILVFGSMTFVDYNFTRPGYSIFFFIIALFLTNYSVTALGIFVSALLKKSESAILPVLIIIIMQVVFAGTVLEFDAPVKYLYYITPTMYGSSILGNVTDMNAMRTLREIYDYNIYASAALMVVIAVVLHVLTVLKLKRDYRTKD